MDKPQIYTGKLDAFFESGTEGILWSLYEHGKEGYDALQSIQEGDYLIIYSDETLQTLFTGFIKPDYNINRQPYPLNPTYSQPCVLGYWCHWLIKEVPPEVWANYFFQELEATLIKL